MLFRGLVGLFDCCCLLLLLVGLARVCFWGLFDLDFWLWLVSASCCGELLYSVNFFGGGFGFVDAFFTLIMGYWY